MSYKCCIGWQGWTASEAVTVYETRSVLSCDFSLWPGGLTST